MINFKLIIKSKKIETIWFVSYCCVLIVPIILSLFTYFQNEKILSKQVDRLKMQILSNKSQYTESVAREIIDLAKKISFDSSIASIASTNNAGNTYQLFQTIKGFQTYDSLQGIVSNIYVYFPKNDFVLSSTTSLSSKDFFQAYYINRPEYENKWYSMLRGECSGDFIDIFGSSGNSVFYSYSTVYSITSDNSPIIIVEADKSAILESPYTDYIGDFCILNKSGDIIASDNKIVSRGMLKSVKWNAVNVEFEKQFEGQKYVVSSVSSRNSTLRYIYILEESSYISEISNLRFQMYIGLAVCILLGFGLIFLSVYWNSKPVKNIISKLREYDVDDEGVHNEYEYIDNAVTKSIIQKLDFEKKIDRQKRSIRESILQKLLKGGADDRYGILENLSSSDINFEHNYFCVGLFCINDVSKLYFEENNGNNAYYRQAQFIVSNIMEEMLNKKFHAFIFECDNLLSCIINMASDYEAGEIIQIIQEAQEFIEKNFNFDFTVATSAIHSNLHGIERAYSEAKANLEYKFILWNEGIIVHNDVEQLNTNEHNYFYPMEKEQQIINSIKTGDYERSVNTLNEILDINFSNNHLSVQLSKYLMFDIVGTMIKTMNELGELKQTDLFERFDLFERLNSCDTAMKMRMEMNGIIKEICDYIKEYSTNTTSKLVERVVKFIDEQYNDSNLNVAIISIKFDISPNYLSAVFKKSVGIGILEYITNTRICEAKKLLRSSNMTIDRVASSVGYTNTSTFSRVFIKAEGIPPGKYRNMDDKAR